MKDKLLKLLQAKEERKKELGKKINETEDVKELRAINAELDDLNGEITELRSMIDAIKKEEGQGEEGGQGQEQRSAGPIGAQEILAAFGLKGGKVEEKSEPEDPFGTMEYRKSFMEFCRTGKSTPEFRKMQPEMRGSDAMTTTAEVTAMIPSTILREIIKEAKVYGQIFSRVRLINIRGGVTVPILTLKPTATRIGETTPSDKKNVQANTSVTFNYYGLECKVATSLLAETVTLEGFENLIKDLIGEAMIKKTEQEIISGTGDGQCLGITKDTRVPAANIVTLKADEFGAWDAWKKKVFAKMPLAYKAGATFLMASGTWEGYIDGMVDANGQPVGRTNYGITNGPQERFGGKEVIQVEDDIIAPYDDASVGDVVAIYCNLKNYAINSNLQMMMFRYFDHDTNEWIDKAILINDGKLLDPHGVVIVKKGA